MHSSIQHKNPVQTWTTTIQSRLAIQMLPWDRDEKIPGTQITIKYSCA